jgi:hypothetical protein
MLTVLGIAAGLATVGVFVMAALAYYIEQRRVRPIVICHEAKTRHSVHELDQGWWAASVYLTNESSASAFNIRFGINMKGRHMAWRHDPDEDEKASRINVLRPNRRDPDGGALYDVRIDDRVLWDLSQADRDVDEGRSYWAYYQGPAGDWWYTSNPFERSAELEVRRVRSRRLGPITRGNRALLKSIDRGLAIRTQSIRELNEMADAMKERREEEERSKQAAQTEATHRHPPTVAAEARPPADPPGDDDGVRPRRIKKR